jgi:hypothetical protein
LEKFLPEVPRTRREQPEGRLRRLKRR